MDLDTIRAILLAAAGVITGGGFLKLLDFFWFKRAKIRQINTASDVDTSTVAVNQAKAYETQVKGLLEDVAALREQAHDVRAQLERLENRAEQERRVHAEQLAIASSENTRLATRNAQLQTDLAIAQRQHDQLRDELRRRDEPKRRQQ